MKWDGVRRAVYFVLGVVLICDAAIQAGSNVPEMVVGLVLLGLIPAETLVGKYSGNA